MPRNMSFMLTTQQVVDQTKTVTRRLGWAFLKPGDIVNACEKCMGLKKGEKVKKLATIRIVSSSFEWLDRMVADEKYGDAEAKAEGFPEMTGGEFVDMFCHHMKVDPGMAVNRIEFEYV